METTANNNPSVSLSTEIKIFENIDSKLVWSRETIYNKEVVHIYQVQLENKIMFRGKSYFKSETLFKKLLKERNNNHIINIKN